MVTKQKWFEKKWFVVLVGAIVAIALVVSGIAVGGMQKPEIVEAEVEIEIPVQDMSVYQDGQPFRFTVTNAEVPVVRIMQAGFLAACEDYGLDCVLMTVDGNDIAGIVEKTEQSIALGSSGILATVYDKAMYGNNIKAIEAGIPVVNGHFPLTDEIPGLSGWVAPDNKGYAIEAANAMADKLACAGPVAVTQSSLNDGENAVAEAFTGRMAELCPDVEVLEPQLEDTDPAVAIAVTSAIIQANPDLAGAFSTTGGGATAWAISAGENDSAVVIIGMDCSRENLDLLKAGDVYALIAQPLFSEMYHGVVLLLEIVMGHSVPYENTLPAPLVFQDGTAPYYEILEMAEAIE